MKRVTLDHNCIIDALNKTDAGQAVRAAVLNPQYSCCIVNIGASEMKQHAVRPDRYDMFALLLEQAGLSHLPRLDPMGIHDVTFWDRCLWANDSMAAQAEEIEQILFPNSPRPTLAPDQLETPLAAKLLNRTCDVHTIWAHIHYGNDIFCTSDSNFHKATRAPRLIAIGAGEIKRPAEL